ncbi:MAG: flagellar basal body-associated FliL family protein [Planctomycetaceae bacterium]|nr:flagellar basal body-associated FliL family protein [Planctomycetaceae bacterium]
MMAEEEATSTPEIPAVDKKNLIVLAAMVLVTMVAAAAGGHFASRVMHTTAATQPAQATQPAAEPAESSTAQPTTVFVNFEPIIVNANEPRLQRYIRAAITLVIRREHEKQVNDLLAKRKDEVKNWMITYLSGCSLEEVRGPRNLNRVRREIHDSLNEMLWPSQKPLIENVLLKEFQVQ